MELADAPDSPRRPVWSVPAEDPGVGKTIMSEPLIGEPIVREEDERPSQRSGPWKAQTNRCCEGVGLAPIPAW